MGPLIVPLNAPEALDLERFGPKAASLARLGRAGLPVPDGFCVDAAGYRYQLAALGLTGVAQRVGSAHPGEARRAALAIKLGFLDQPIAAKLREPLREAWRGLKERSGASTVVRSSALVEDRPGSSFAGQFESYLGLEDETEFETAVRSCMPVEIEWALDHVGFKLLQARALHLGPAPAPDEIWLRHPSLNGHPAGVGWGSGRARVVNCECELARVGAGDVLITKIAGPALSQVFTQVAGVVVELGGSTSHLASLARERGVPMVLGVLDATRRIPEGVQVAVDGVAGVVRWMH